MVARQGLCEAVLVEEVLKNVCVVVEEVVGEARRSEAELWSMCESEVVDMCEGVVTQEVQDTCRYVLLCPM